VLIRPLSQRCALALGSMYLLWTRDKPEVQNADADESGTHAPREASRKQKEGR